jgi:hypothetical protein
MAQRPAAQRADIPILIGLSTALYAASLAGVTGLQASQDAAARARTSTMASAVSDAQRDREALDLAVRAAGSAYNQEATAYADARDRIDRLAREVAALAATVQAVSGSAAQLPATAPMRAPAQVVTISAPAAAPMPAVQATTGASG